MEFFRVKVIQLLHCGFITGFVIGGHIRRRIESLKGLVLPLLVGISRRLHVSRILKSDFRGRVVRFYVNVPVQKIVFRAVVQRIVAAFQKFVVKLQKFVKRKRVEINVPVHNGNQLFLRRIG